MTQHNNTPKHANPFDQLIMDPSIDAEFLIDESAALHTTYACGGIFKHFVIANTISALQQILRTCKKCGVEVFMIGRGSNLLVSDRGFDGLVVSLGTDFRNLKLDEETNTIIAGAGVSFAKVSQLAYANNLSGLEFSVGIPGTVGGALGMNAGTCGVGLCDVVSSVSILDKNDNYSLKKIKKEDFTFGYHTSALRDLGVALECEIPLSVSKTRDLQVTMDEKLKQRNALQPLGHNCGSVFKNPEGMSAGKLIEDCGLKGTRIGGAEISPMHANFFPNVGDATSQDVMDLILLAKEEVFKKFGVELEPEVQFLGF